jgi:hypothetical protein
LNCENRQTSWRTGEVAELAGRRRKAKEWNLIGTLFSASVVKRHNLVTDRASRKHSIKGPIRSADRRDVLG